MAKQGSTRSSSQRKGYPLLAGVLIGIVVGLLVAGGIAWYILKSPSPFVSHANNPVTKLEPDAPVAAKTIEPPAETAETSDQPRFEFYKVLTDNQMATTPSGANKSVVASPPASKGSYYLQAGAFTDPNDADRLKAHLAMLGIEATVQDATLPDKTQLHRVRIGPFKSSEEMNKTAAILKQNDISSTPMRLQ